MANKRLNVLLWDKDNNSVYGKKAYYYTDLKELLTRIMLDDSTENLPPDDLENFDRQFRAGYIKHSVVVKNHNGNKDDTPFQNIKDGGYFVRGRVTKDEFDTDFTIKDSTNNYGWGRNSTYCELSTPRDFNDYEKKIIEEVLEQALSVRNQDRVFNLFTFLCTAKNVVWKDYPRTQDSVKGYYNDNRSRSFLGFLTTDLFHAKDVETRERVAKRIATCAWLLTKQLTGYELRLKDYPDDDFIEGLMAARYLQNDDVIVKKVCEPTMTMKDLLKLATQKADVADGNIIAAQVCLSKILGKTGSEHNRKLEDFLDMSGVKNIEITYYGDGLKPEDFKDIDNCLVWNPNVSNYVFRLYIWDELITTREMFDTDREFITVLTNNK